MSTPSPASPGHQLPPPPPPAAGKKGDTSNIASRNITRPCFIEDGDKQPTGIQSLSLMNQTHAVQVYSASYLHVYPIGYKLHRVHYSTPTLPDKECKVRDSVDDQCYMIYDAGVHTKLCCLSGMFIEN